MSLIMEPLGRAGHTYSYMQFERAYPLSVQLPGEDTDQVDIR